ncbi:LytR/AlgR family response regulator transcription factor [Paenibacillus thailandensis]|uniref:LytR/AlgR family response regulator transcription factor n=1 Tax=Paenibacillus thailandensis TaxID=393250 RepID=A0ABW5R4R8_9BACL
MKRIIALIAEDERLARDELAYLLGQEPDIELAGFAANGRELLDIAPVSKPDVVFLDVQMPELEGVQAARLLNGLPCPPLIVFTTAYDHYAVEAFGLNAVDYLLKPYSGERLKEALLRVRGRLAAAAPSGQAIAGGEPLQRSSNAAVKAGKLLLDDGDKLVLVEPGAIVYAVREDRVICVHTEEGRRIGSRLTLQELEEKLEGHAFFRPHRSYLVNLNRIAEITPWLNGAYNITMKDAARTSVPLSREAAKELFRLLRSM